MQRSSARSFSGGSQRWLRAAAILEVTGVFVAGNIAASYLGQWLGALRHFGGQILGMDALATLGGVLCAVAVTVGFQRWPGGFIVLGLSGLVVALLLEYRERRLARTTSPLRGGR